VLKANPAADLTIDVALARNKIPGYETTSSMAARHGAIAAVNGDYTGATTTRTGRPVNIFAEDGDLKTSPLIWGRNFAISLDEKEVFIKHASLSIWMTHVDSGRTWNIKSWNESDPPPGFAGYTPAGGYAYPPPKDACSARLYPAGKRTWTSSANGVETDFVVDKVRCRSKRLGRQGGTVVSAPRRTRYADKLSDKVVQGETIRLGWSMGWAGALDTVGGNPNLVENGRIAVGECPTSIYFCRRHPRTGVGVTATGRLLLVTVDGRQRGRSVGMRPRQFAKLFQYLGAKWALNLDGGGSTTMVVDNKVVNRPSGGYQRPIGTALLVLPGADRREVEPRPFPTATSSPMPGGQGLAASSPPRGADGSERLNYPTPDPECLALRDPASTGGLLDALARGSLAGPPTDVSPEFRRAVRVFRGDASCGSHRVRPDSDRSD
jgi:hypothetical protein